MEADRMSFGGRMSSRSSMQTSQGSWCPKINGVQLFGDNRTAKNQHAGPNPNGPFIAIEKTCGRRAEVRERLPFACGRIVAAAGKGHVASPGHSAPNNHFRTRPDRALAEARLRG